MWFCKKKEEELWRHYSDPYCVYPVSTNGMNGLYAHIHDRQRNNDNMSSKEKDSIATAFEGRVEKCRRLEEDIRTLQNEYDSEKRDWNTTTITQKFKVWKKEVVKKLEKENKLLKDENEFLHLRLEKLMYLDKSTNP